MTYAIAGNDAPTHAPMRLATTNSCLRVFSNMGAMMEAQKDVAVSPQTNAVAMRIPLIMCQEIACR